MIGNCYMTPNGVVQYCPSYFQPLYLPLYMIPILQPQQIDPNQFKVPFYPNDENKLIKIQESPKEEVKQLNSENISYSSVSYDIATKEKQGKLTNKQYLKKVDKKNNNTNLFKESTNYQKNFAKALIIYSQKQIEFVIQVLGSKKAQEFLSILPIMKNKIRNITHVSQYTQDMEFLKLFRILGFKFLRTECVAYIYNSKIQQKTNHLKRKQIIKKAVVKI